MLETSEIVERVTREYYMRMNTIPDSYVAAYQLRQRDTWEQLTDTDREHYRRLIAPVVHDTLALLEL